MQFHHFTVFVPFGLLMHRHSRSGEAQFRRLRPTSTHAQAARHSHSVFCLPAKNTFVIQREWRSHLDRGSSHPSVFIHPKVMEFASSCISITLSRPQKFEQVWRGHFKNLSRLILLPEQTFGPLLVRPIVSYVAQIQPGRLSQLFKSDKLTLLC